MGRSESVLLGGVSRVSGVSGVSGRIQASASAFSSRVTGLSELAGLFWAAEVLEEPKPSDLSGPLQQTAGTAAEPRLSNNRISAHPPPPPTFGTYKLEFQQCVSVIETEMEAFC